jgi:tRNA pseudouridine55 synthase
VTSEGSTEGLLPVDKPAGPTSHDLVARARRDLGIRRVGHTGTLDPFASGLLLLCLGRATRLAEYLQSLPKEYEARATLGRATTTHDPEGDTTATADSWRTLKERDILDVLQGFVGRIQQRPPRFSAKKVGGRTAYARARKGEPVSLSPVWVTIHEMSLQAVDLPHVSFRVRCGTGTYVRAIARDLGELLGVGAHLSALRRSAIGPFRVEHAILPEALTDSTHVSGALVPPLVAVSHLPRLEVSREEAVRLEHGQSLELDLDRGPGCDGDLALVFQSRLLAVGVREGERVKPKKVFSLE